MIVSASYRSDIPAFHGDWFRAQLAAGDCRVANPYGGPDYSVSLRSADVDGFVFWTRNLDPFAAALADVERRAIPFTVTFTITGFPRALEAATISINRSVDQLKRLRGRHGPRVAVWRYDPIVVSSLTPAAWHRDNFARLAARLAGTVDEVVVSWMQPYRKTKANMDAAARRHGFAWRDPPDADKRRLLSELQTIAAAAGLTLSLCGQRHLLVDGIADAACIDARRLADVAGREFPGPRRAHRKECGCWASKDIGAYDTCTQGCAYCYAVRNRDAAKIKLRRPSP